jgi:hypothetical protein
MPVSEKSDNRVIERVKTNSLAELIKALIMASAEVGLSPEQMMAAEDDSRRIKEAFKKILEGYKK